MAVISAEKLRDYNEGPAETAKIAQALMSNSKMSQYLIDKEAWDCIWDELIVQGKGLKTVYDRPHTEESYNFSADMLEEMIHELDRLISKYSSTEWNTKSTANRLVELLTEHRGLIQTELDEVNAGIRKLSSNDILGPNERERRRTLVIQGEVEGEVYGTKKNNNFEWFKAMERELDKRRREQMKN